MEEDHRAYHPSHPFRQYQYQRISDIAGLDDCTETLLDQLPPAHGTKQECSSHATTHCATITSSRNGNFGFRTITTTRSNAFERSLPSLAYLLKTTAADDSSTSTRNSTRGMTSVEGDSPNNAATTSKQRFAENSRRFVEETHGLFYDYQRRFHRQSLTGRAEKLLEQAFTKNIKGSNDDHAANLMLCTDALELCQKATKYQEDDLHNDNLDSIGGSYLVTGDIRIRRKGELLAAKIYCRRAAICYEIGKYSKCLEDCDAAIEIWKHRYGSSGVGNIGGATKKLSGLRSSSSSRGPKSLKLSHKHLYLLKGRALALLGSYQEAARWLLHPNELPCRNFRGSSQLLQNDGIMNSVLLKIAIRGRGRKTASPARTTTATSNIDDRPAGIVATATRQNSIPTNKKLWSHLLHSVDKRLNNGGAAAPKTPAGDPKTNSSSANASSSSAIYQILRYGPVLFHHYEDEDSFISESTSSLAPAPTTTTSTIAGEASSSPPPLSSSLLGQERVIFRP